MDQDEQGIFAEIDEGNGVTPTDAGQETTEQSGEGTVEDSTTQQQTASEQPTEQTTEASEQTSQETQQSQSEEPKQQTEEESVQNQETQETEGQEGETTEEQPEATELEDWKRTLPPPPRPYEGPTPEVDENGNITNMSREQYEDYLISKAEERANQRSYQNLVETRALDAAEKILPEIATNQSVRQMVENTRIAAVLNGENITSYEAAERVKEAMGISEDKIAEAKAKGSQSAKTSIETQKRAAVETGANATPDTDSKSEELTRRIHEGDDEAFVELFDIWQDKGIL